MLILINITIILATVTIKMLTKAVLILLSAGYAYSSEPSVLHDTCNSWMFICLHAPSVHPSKLHCLRIRTPAGQGHGRLPTQDHLHLKNSTMRISWSSSRNFVLWSSGKNWHCNEHPGYYGSFPRSEHVGYRHVWLGYLSRMGTSSQ